MTMTKCFWIFLLKHTLFSAQISLRFYWNHMVKNKFLKNTDVAI